MKGYIKWGFAEVSPRSGSNENIFIFLDTEYLDDDQDAGIHIMFITFADDTKLGRTAIKGERENST